MKNLLYSIMILGLLTSCTKFPDPSIELTNGYTFYKNGSNQRASAGEFLEDSISIQILGINGSTVGMRVEFSIATGNGELTNPVTNIDQTGLAYAYWKMGTTTNKQTAKASIYDAKGILINSVEYTAYAFLPDKWNKVEAGTPDAGMWDLAADTISNKTFMISYSNLYRQTDLYYNWEPVNVAYNGLTAVEMDGRSFIYVVDFNGEVYLSKDAGNTWSKCNKPFAANSGYTELFVSNNNCVWASAQGKNLAYSKDEGYSWHDASAGLEEGDGLGEIYQHPDGTLFFRTTNYRLFKSVNDGGSWTRVTTQDRADELFMTANGDLLLYAAYSAKHRILKSTDKGEHFTELYSTTMNSWSSKLNFFNYYKGMYYMLIPGKGIIRTNDLVNFDNYWLKSDLLNLFIDHNGVLMARDLSNNIYYRANP